MSEQPHRVQLRRTKGWRMPPGTVSVARPTIWGNPARIVRTGMLPLGDETDEEPGVASLVGPWACLKSRPDAPMSGWWFATRAEAVAKAVDWYRFVATEPFIKAPFRARIPELRGKNLACWCPLDQPCHADVLLELANA